MLSPSRLDLDPSGPRPAALSTVSHYEKTYRAPQRTNHLDSARYFLYLERCVRSQSHTSQRESHVSISPWLSPSLGSALVKPRVEHG